MSSHRKMLNLGRASVRTEINAPLVAEILKRRRALGIGEDFRVERKAA